MSSDGLWQNFNISGGQKKYITILLILSCIGVIAILSSNALQKTPAKMPEAASLVSGNDTPLDEASELIRDEERLANDLAEALEAVKGVGEVVVKVTLATTTETQYAQENQTNQTTISEISQNGGTKSTDETREEVKLVMKNNDRGSNEPIIIKQNRPEVVGVIVVADGADNLQIKSQIANAVQVLLDIPPHKVTVLPKAKEE